MAPLQPDHGKSTGPATARPLQRRLRRRLLRWTGIVLVLLVIAELGLRWKWGFGHPLLYSYDAACNYLPAPNQHIRRFSCLNEINAFNMRSPPVQDPKPANEMRVLFIGDSVVYGTTYVDQADIFTSILDRELPQQLHRPVEVLNASAGGWAPDNELAYLQSRGTFHSDLVIFVINSGDFVQPFNKVVLSSGTGDMPMRPPAFAIEEVCVRYLWPRLVHALPAADAGSKPSPDVVPMEHNLDSLRKARQLANAAGAGFAVVYSPFKSAQWDTPETAARETVFHLWAHDQHVPLVDLSSAFAKAGMTRMLDGGLHLHVAGNRVAATTIEEHWSEIAASQTASPAGNMQP